MEDFNSIILEMPLVQVIILLSLSTIFLLLKRDRLALLTNYVFILYWGYFFNQDIILSLSETNLDYFVTCYFGFGIAVAALSVFSFIFSDGGVVTS